MFLANSSILILFIVGSDLIVAAEEEDGEFGEGDRYGLCETHFGHPSPQSGGDGGGRDRVETQACGCL